MAYKLVFVFLLQSVICNPVLSMIPSIEEYFPDLSGDLTRLEWLHAVNSQILLEEGLKNSTIQMLEADVIFAHLKGVDQPMPVMGHPPALISDLSLYSFVQEVIKVQNSSKKGMKLDFKSDKAYNTSFSILNAAREKLTFPVWLNADILKGPGNPSPTPLDAKNFVAMAKEHLPDAPLSLGWTTNFKEGIGYTDEMLTEMRNIVESEEVKQPITLAVRAAFAALSEKGLVDLVHAIDNFQGKNQTTLTVWMSSTTDKVDIPKLRSLMATLGTSRIVLDVPTDIRNQLIDG